MSGFEEKERKDMIEDQTNAAAKARFKYLTETPVPKLIGKLAVPTIISMLVTAIYNTADTYFVGKVST